nr:hypothetical protein BdHM001_09620 [Bdellovibrio sp. HM001]
MKVMVKSLLAVTAIYLSACSSSSDSEAPPSTTVNEVSALMTSINKTLDTATASSNIVPGFVPLAKTTQAPFYLAAAITCSDGGFFEDHNDPDWASKQLYCLTRTQGTGPDTLLGAFAQATGFVCSVGSLTFDGVERAATMKISTACFPQNFVDVVQTQFGKTSFNVDVTALDISATHKLGEGTVNSAWTKALQIKFGTDLSAQVGSGYTIMVKDDAGAKAVAVHDGLVLAGGTTSKEVFAVYVNPGASGSLAYEGRFATPDASFSRHLRLYLGGNINATTLVASDVNDMAFVWGDGANSDNSTYASFASIKGTPAAGRKVLSQWWNGSEWQNANGHDECYGEGTPLCTGNTGIDLAADKKFFFQGGYTTSYDWFINNSYLSHFDMDVTIEDIQQ